MDFKKLKDRAADATRRVAASEQAQRLMESDTVRKIAESQQAQAVKQLAADQVAHLGPKLREIVAMDEDRPLSPERLLLMLVAAVHSDGEVELSLQDVRGAGKRNERMAAAAGIIGGGPGCFVADMYCDAALYCLLVDCFDLAQSDKDIAAHLLVAWGGMPDLATARAAMNKEDPQSVVGYAVDRFKENVGARTKKETILVLWRLRSGNVRIPIFDPSTFKDLFFAGRALQHRLEAAAAQLGIPREDVRKPSLLRRRRADSQPSAAARRIPPANEEPKVVRPIVVQPADLPGFSARLEAVVRATYGPDAAIRSAVQSLSESVGGVDPWRLLQLGLHPEETKRPWRWFAQACELANEQAEYGIPPRVFVFTFWFKNLQQKMTINDFADMWLDPIPPDAYQAILKATAEAISHFADDHPVAQTANEVLTAGQIHAAVEAAIVA